MNFIRFISRCWLLHVLFLLSFFSVKAQILDYSYTHYGKEDGLPSNIIYCMIADRDGILWIGSDAGLTRFDGLHTKTFTTKDGLPTNDIFSLYCDHQNRIWLTGLSNQIAYCKNGRVYHAGNDSNVAKINIASNCNAVFEDDNGTIWIINSNLVIYKLDSSNKLLVDSLSSKLSYLSIPLNYLKLNDTLLLFGGSETLFFKMNKSSFYLPSSTRKIMVKGINKVGNKFYYLRNDDKQLYPVEFPYLFKNILGTQTTNWNLFVNHDHQLVFPNVQGISFYDTTNLKRPVASFLSKYSILNYYNDKLGNHWVSTNGNGLFKINSKINKIYKNDLDETSNKFQSVFVEGDYYFLGDNKAILTMVDRKKITIVRQVDFNRVRLVNCRILKISKYASGVLAVSTDNGFYLYNYRTDKIEFVMHYGSCKNHFIEKNQTIILNNEGVVRSTPQTGKVDKYVIHKRFYSYLKYYDEIILGSQDGLNLFNDNVFKPYELNEPFSFRVMDMIQVDSLLILATINGGIYFIKNHKVLQKLNTDNGLSSNNCFKLFLHENELYIGSSNGVNIYNFKKKTIRSLNESDGLTSNSVNDIQILNDTLYTATENGLSIIPIRNLDDPPKFQLFNKPTVINKDTIWTNISDVETRTNWSFILNLNSLSYGNKGQIAYYYKGMNADSNFQLTSNPQLKLQFPEPGNYTIYAYAINSNNKASNIISFHVYVKPYFWQTLLFKIAISILLLILLYLLFQLLIKRARMNEIRKRQLDQKLFKLELAAWRSKVNPHFLFNSLNSVNSLIKTSQYQKAIDFIGNFAGILRQTIENSGKMLNTVESEIEYIRKYLDLEILKRDNQFKYSIQCNDATIWSYYIPSLLIQPVIENSIKHSIREKRDGAIEIQFFLEPTQLRCEISDNGYGGELIQHTLQQQKSIGLELIEDKIRILESILHKQIIFTYNYETTNTITGSKTTFLFPILISNNYDTDNFS